MPIQPRQIALAQKGVASRSHGGPGQIGEPSNEVTAIDALGVQIRVANLDDSSVGDRSDGFEDREDAPAAIVFKRKHQSSTAKGPQPANGGPHRQCSEVGEGQIDGFRRKHPLQTSPKAAGQWIGCKCVVQETAPCLGKWGTLSSRTDRLAWLQLRRAPRRRWPRG